MPMWLWVIVYSDTQSPRLCVSLWACLDICVCLGLSGRSRVRMHIHSCSVNDKKKTKTRAAISFRVQWQCLWISLEYTALHRWHCVLVRSSVQLGLHIDTMVCRYFWKAHSSVGVAVHVFWTHTCFVEKCIFMAGVYIILWLNSCL